ncbi:nickel-type superoxide dismutase maturation protease [Actinacidiphila paucisporea]|uniref:Nickel-type superoxide dismutase maturation protease n=1 Tax=Actinacidiphila paucisporea TaxID=310782 RepID=A0A1M6V5L0_9ACTN|nr:nickel-type superoxide dismutase maturation protease [Actinacidiphila paucisporea]SHK76782.1 nickel-type superoxide dismutase maturation protease [Actinacidiphila paucisporea]
MREQGARLSWQLVEVTGPSMAPTLLHGDWLLIQKISSGAELVREGDVVVLKHPLQQDLLIVKRAVERREGGWWVLGDNTFVENDSREFGMVPDDLVLARARGRFRPPRELQGRFRRPRELQRSVAGVASWAASCVRPLRPDRSLSRRLRAR